MIAIATARGRRALQRGRRRSTRKQRCQVLQTTLPQRPVILSYLLPLLPISSPQNDQVQNPITHLIMHVPSLFRRFQAKQLPPSVHSIRCLSSRKPVFGHDANDRSELHLPQDLSSSSAESTHSVLYAWPIWKSYRRSSLSFFAFTFLLKPKEEAARKFK